MPTWICTTCAVQYPDTAEPPTRCPICEDERQYVGWDGQRFTTAADLARDHATDIREEEPGLLGIGVTPAVGIGQRAAAGAHRARQRALGRDPAARRGRAGAIAAAGGIDTICISHPHFYGAHVDIADAFDARVLLPRADEQWIQRRSDRVELFDDRVDVLPGVTLARIGGHFDGAAVLHWAAGAGGRGALLTGDTITVVQDREWVSFMWSYPNLIPLDADTVRTIADRVSPFRFDRIYGGWWGRVVLTDGPGAVRRSAARYIARIQGP